MSVIMTLISESVQRRSDLFSKLLDVDNDRLVRNNKLKADRDRTSTLSATIFFAGSG